MTFATVTYDEFSDVSNIDYPSGIKLGGITRDQLGRENSNTYTLASGQQIVETVERHISGDIKQGSENGVNKSYSYDNAGRLIAAQIGDNNFAYEFGQPDAACQNIPGYNPHTAKNGNRTKLTINGQSTTFCYDQADRLISASDPSLTSAQYDSHGNTTSLGKNTYKTTFTYDAADRNMSIQASDKQTIYSRDAQDRIISREAKQGSEVQSLVNYGFTGSGDSPDFLTNSAGEVVEKYLTLPGDILATIKPNVQSAGATTFSLPNIHGDTMATINADGTLTGTFMTGPFGEALPNQTHPNNTTPGTTWNYLGQHQKLTETESSSIPGGIIQMGARLYIPILGRFLQVDPVEGGTDNNYVYANDPVNEFDLDGKAIPVLFLLGNVARIAAPHVARAAVRYIARPAAKHIAKFAVKRAVPLLKKGAKFLTKKITPALNNLAGRTWAGGSRAMNAHFARHGRAMGYKQPWRYTVGAIRNTIRTTGMPLRSRSVAHINGRKVTLWYRGKISSYFRNSSIRKTQKWFRNQALRW